MTCWRCEVPVDTEAPICDGCEYLLNTIAVRLYGLRPEHRGRRVETVRLPGGTL